MKRTNRENHRYLRNRARRHFPTVEGLETRQLLASIYNVTLNTGTDQGTLYDAITQVNAGLYDTINFQLPAEDLTISLTLPLPQVRKQVTIDGYSENSFLGSPSTTPLVVIQDPTPGTSTNGLVLASGSDNSKITGLNITGFTLGSAINVQSSFNQIVGNFIGTDTTGTAAGFGGGNRTGISVTGSNNKIGGSGADANVIAFNTGTTATSGGVSIVVGVGNTITQNSIFANTNPIILTSNGNANQAAPVLSAVLSTGGTTTVQGTFTTSLAGSYTLEFFASESTDPDTPGQAHIYLGSMTVTAIAGINPFTATLSTPTDVPLGQRVTATVTYPTTGNTSELSNDQVVGAPTLTVNPVNITYGTPLQNSQLVGNATFTIGGNLTIVPGTFTYTTDEGVILNAGDGQAESVTFTPNDTSTYATTTTTVVVNVAKALPVITVTGVSTTYDGQPHPATGTAFGVLTPPENLTSLLHLSYRDSSGNVSASAPVNAGTYDVLASFDGNANYQTISLQGTGQQVVIATAAATFVNLSSPTVVVGSVLTTLSGQLVSGGVVPSGTVTVDTNGALYTTTVRIDGTFAVAVPTASLLPGTYTAEYFYSGNSNVIVAGEVGTYDVAIGTSALFNNERGYRPGSVVPVALTTVDAWNTRLKSPTRTVTALGIATASDPNTLLPLPPGSRRNGRFNRSTVPAGQRFSYRLTTTGLTAGSYILYYTISDDPTSHSLSFIVGRAHPSHRAAHAAIRRAARPHARHS